LLLIFVAKLRKTIVIAKCDPHVSDAYMTSAWVITYPNPKIKLLKQNELLISKITKDQNMYEFILNLSLIQRIMENEKLFVSSQKNFIKKLHYHECKIFIIRLFTVYSNIIECRSKVIKDF
jgi:hypothetical protein